MPCFWSCGCTARCKTQVCCHFWLPLNLIWNNQTPKTQWPCYHTYKWWMTTDHDACSCRSTHRFSTQKCWWLMFRFEAQTMVCKPIHMCSEWQWIPNHSQLQTSTRSGISLIASHLTKGSILHCWSSWEDCNINLATLPRVACIDPKWA